MDDEAKRFLEEATSIDPLRLQEEFVKLPGQLAFYNEEFSEALRTYLAIKLLVDETKSYLYLKHREQLMASGVKFTETLIEAYVGADPKLHDVRATFVEAEAKKSRLYGIVDALRAKKDALVSIGAGIRAEMAGNPSLKYAAQDNH